MTDVGGGPPAGVRRMMPGLLAESLVRHASRTAVLRAGGPALSYRDLAAAAADVTDLLAGEGVRTGDTVLFCGERGLGHVLTVLAAWRLGAAVAVAPPGPDARRDSVRRRVRPRAVLDDVAGGRGVRVLGGDPGPSTRPPGAGRGRGVDGADLAYLLPTSGTTGEPKVVAVPHGAFARRCAWAQRAYPLTPGDVVLASSSPAFDFCLWETFAPLAAGASVAFAPAAAEAEPEVLAAFMLEHRVTVAHFVPSLLALFVEDGGGAALAALRLLLLGGEPLTAELCRRVRQVSAARLWNQYGPTETCIDAVSHEITDDDLATRDVPIGAPVDGAEVCVLDAAGHPVEPGGVGELHIGGALLAWGYLGMGGRTADQFVPAPTGPPGGRRYRSGDLVRRRHDGLLVHAGRTDQQIKIRGVRLEPTEVEAVLRAHPHVREAAVVVGAGAGHLRRLLAHVVPAGPLSGDELRAHLAARLPAAAVPARIVLRPALPRLASGKVDRGALAADDGSGADDPAAPAPLDTELQVLVGGIWSGVLNVPASASMHFFEAGGSSLTAMRAAARVRRATGRQIPVRLMFEAPVLETYAARLRDLIDP
ncbi:MAG: hypothetical protein V7637_1950 [Mycobacteriales bacterium]